MTSNKMSKIGVVSLVTAIVGWLGGVLAGSTFFVASQPSESLLKLYILHYFGWFAFVPLLAFVLGNAGATVLGSIGYAGGARGEASSRAIVYSKSAMIMGSAGLVVAAGALLFTVFRSGS